MTNEAAIQGGAQGVPSGGSDAGAGQSVDVSPTSTQAGGQNSSDNVTTSAVQSDATQQPTQETDPLQGIPSTDEVQKMETVSKEAFLRLRGAYDDVAPKFKDLNAKYESFSPILERFEQPDQLQSAVDLNNKIFSEFERDPDSGQLIPATQAAADYLIQKDVQRTGFLWADLAEKEIPHPQNGQPISLIDFALEGMRDDPARRATALKILGGVEPSSIAPTWQPSAEELEVVRPELQDIYKGLPYDDRESLKLNDPAFINKYLADQKFKDDLISENRQAKEHEQREVQRREQYMQQRAQEAGNSFVETGFRTGMTEFTNSIVEKSQFIAPIDPNSEAAKAMDPNQLTQFNQSAQRINTGVGKFIATITAALAVPDTAWFAGDFLKELGVDPGTIQKFDEARQNYANNARNYGELNFQLTGGQPRNGGSVPEGLTAAQYQASQAMKSMKGYGNLVSQSLMKLFSEFFEMKAGSYNAQLNGSGTVRPQVNGSHFDPTTAPANLPAGPMSRQEIERLYG